jgi:hypothetical protein
VSDRDPPIWVFSKKPKARRDLDEAWLAEHERPVETAERSIKVAKLIRAASRVSNMAYVPEVITTRNITTLLGATKMS